MKRNHDAVEDAADANRPTGFAEAQGRFGSAPIQADTSPVRIPVYRPHFSGHEKVFVADCMESGSISSSIGDYIGKFQAQCSEFIGSPHVIGVANGTVALHLAMMALDIQRGDEVIVPTLTYIASVNAIAYVGATPVFCECDAETWQLDPRDVEARITPKTKAIMVVHLYGQPAPMAAIMAIARKHDLCVIEDAAEAFGSRIGDRHMGTYGDIGTFSFFGNKTLTTGEGGLVVTNDKRLHDEMKLLRGQYVSENRRYWHEKVGYNYRMTNIQAAIGCGQFVDLEWVLDRKRALAKTYASKLAHLPVTMHTETPGTRHNFWMCSLLVDQPDQRDMLMSYLDVRGIDTRPVFYPAHTMPMYRDAARGQNFPISENISSRGINLPSYPDLTEADIDRVCAAVGNFFAQ